VIVSDIGMPGKDGLEMMRELRASSSAEQAKIPAIALTAFARSEDRTRAMLAGYQVHLSKPVEPQELLAAVANLSGRTGAIADNSAGEPITDPR
jgi:CheY-like chemotaxis protein